MWTTVEQVPGHGESAPGRSRQRGSGRLAPGRPKGTNAMPCPCCGSAQTQERPVLWRALIDEWRLASHEAAYVDRQQGLHCTACGSNLRSMALAKAVMACFGHPGPFAEFV